MMQTTRSRGELTTEELYRILEPRMAALRQLVGVYAALTELAGASLKGSEAHIRALSLWSNAYVVLRSNIREFDTDSTVVQVQLGKALCRLLLTVVCRTPAEMIEHASEIRAAHEQLQKIARRLARVFLPAATVKASWNDLLRAWRGAGVVDLDRPGTIPFAFVRVLADMEGRSWIHAECGSSIP